MNLPPTARPALASIPVDLPCFGCRYNLRTLSPDAICPECAMPVRRTLKHGWLIFADPAWLRKIRSGFSWFLLTLLTGALGIAAIVIYVAALGTEPDPGTLIVISWAIGLAFIGSWLVAVWRVTSNEPESNPPRSKTQLDVWIRSLNVAAALVWIPFISISTAGFNTRGNAIGAFAFCLLAYSAFGLGFVLLLVHLRRLGRRHMKPTLGKLLTFLLWGGIALSALSIAFMAISTSLTFMQSSGVGPATTNIGATSMSVQPVPMGVSVSWAPTTAPTSGPAQVAPATTMPTTAAVAVMPAGMGTTMVIGMALAASFYLFVVVWGGAWLLALISFRRILKQTINETAASTYNAWMHSIPSPPQAL